MSTSYDFKEAARGLLARIYGNGSSVSPNKDLIRTAIEVALRDAYNEGLGARKKALSAPAATRSSARAAAPSVDARKSGDMDCSHQWKESFLDGRAVGVQCAKCGALERDLKSQCDHFFVKNGPNEVCVACRTTRRAR